MFKGFLKHINNVINESDIIFELIDARYPEKTRNYELEKKIIKKRKKLVILINKSDLVEKEKIEEEKEKLKKTIKAKIIFVSGKNKKGINLIKKEIGILKTKRTLIVGIIGYPNTGKSTLINSITGKGKGKVATSKKAGLTRGLQKIKLNEGVYLIDSPGIIPRKKEESDLFLVNSKNPNQIKDIEGVAFKIIKELGIENIKKYFKIIEKCNEEELLEIIAKKQNFLLKKAKPDTTKAARYLLEKYQKDGLK
ncbi:MAG: 50S ribosome-binding GTPase [Candidatus ainarchaeum sp.]|nr:50S ribosome-binding GTPase [Candidatus ainarchaeum sp.]